MDVGDSDVAEADVAEVDVAEVDVAEVDVAEVDVADVDAVAEELYGLPLDEFTAARNRYVKQARKAGAKDAAASIQALGKPSAAAGLANHLVRRHGAELAPLLELGTSLRAAMASLSGAELRTLGQQQHKLISALIAQARALASADGRMVNADQARGLEETLHAALADEAAAAQLMTGRLTETLHRSGLGGAGETADRPTAAMTARSAASGATRGKTSAGKASVGKAGVGKAGVGKAGVGKAGVGKAGAGATGSGEAVAAERERARVERAAQAERAAATTKLDQARGARSQAEADAERAELEREQAATAVARLRDELDRATSDLNKADRTRHRLRATVEQARRAERAAQHRLDALTDD